MDILKHNRIAWNKQVDHQNIWTIPVDHETIEKARLGNFSLVLTPTIPVPMSWFGDIKGKQVLCLASGGGQQAPVLAAAGAHVTLLDNSPNQLKQDAMVAKREHLDIKLVLGDMRDLSVFEDETFDLIFHPVSNLFVDDVNRVWKEAYRVLKQKGRMLSGFCNPVLFVFDYDAWEKDNQLIPKYKIPYSDLEQLPKEELQKRIDEQDPLEFGHTLDDQIGGQIKVGFSIQGFFEDKFGRKFLDDYIASFIATLAIK
ncbi:MAG: class I SAM-dependent methyltransferase [Bacillota bacterium]